MTRDAGSDQSTTRDGLDRLRAAVGASTRLLVAYSGGADSALLAWVAHEVLGADAVAVTAVSASLPTAERTAAAQFCRDHAIRHLEICTDELERPEYVRNGANRCFHCKSSLFDAIDPLAALIGADVALGTNLDDLGEHRPGQRAAALRSVRAPLVEAGLTKADVRAVSVRLGLVTADKPAAACLASRVAYGDPVTAPVLAAIERAEAALHRRGFIRCRVRVHAGGTLARIEVPAEQIMAAMEQRAEISTEVRAAGFIFCALDLDGFQSGRMNELLSIESIRAS